MTKRDPNEDIDALMSHTLAASPAAAAGPSLPFHPSAGVPASRDSQTSGLPWSAQVPGPLVVPGVLARSTMPAHLPSPPPPPPQVTAPAQLASPVRLSSVMAAPNPSQPPYGGNEWGRGAPSAFSSSNLGPSVSPSTPPAFHRPLAVAGPLGAVEASHAAADPLADVPRERRAPVPSVTRERVELLWMDSTDAALARATLRGSPAADAELLDQWLEPGAHERAADDIERDEVHGALASSAPQDLEAVEHAFSEALDQASAGRAFALVTGELCPSLDEVAGLGVVANYVATIGNPDDKRLAVALELATRTASSSGRRPPPEAIQVVRARLDEALRATVKDGLRELDPLTERALVQDRAYARRTVFGAEHVVATLLIGRKPVTVYLPEAAAAMLPLVRRLQARLLVEVRGPQEQADTGSVSFRAVAIGRVARR